MLNSHKHAYNKRKDTEDRPLLAIEAEVLQDCGLHCAVELDLRRSEKPEDLASGFL